MNKSGSVAGFLKAFGPGIIFAGAAIGVSHVVQSTRAGADFGFTLVWLILLANVLKYPFFEAGSRYTAATGESLIDGYKRVGNWAFYLYIALTVLTMFIIQAGVTVVAAALAENLFGFGWSVTLWSALIIGTIAILLIAGQYKWLDKVAKAIFLVLIVSVTIAVILALISGRAGDPNASVPSLADAASFAFIIALLGWMPANFEISVWQSLWTIERAKETGHKPTLKESLLDFHLGYWITTIYAVLFVALGALVMFGTGEKFSDSSVGFSAQLVGLFTKSLGDWTWIIIAIAVFFTMFSTTLAVTDAYPRVWRRTVEILVPNRPKFHTVLYWSALGAVATGALLIIVFLGKSLTALVDFAATVSFVTAPLFGWINYKAVTHSSMPEYAKPNNFTKFVALLGMIFVGGFSIVYIVWKFF